ncbi:putative ATP-binding cassette transporter protein YOR1 [Cutaneotrichosporon oleaginosum]|uniref:Putative ATP-binding cassette transporter protein YOR1 n=1 Tax=Cutaneotrichosporon oleaginosum TaxID=879819 RepID=A0A0J0XV20_9TREE|nr:putative ATP-binding cassette transporter protein YOR1 [Cutaneotrichosporon oleaginosum]KLT44908.1 putative ATP-binding cassette transporter protein YOR1 [Cutaneotrichosporon oleaginosum]
MSASGPVPYPALTLGRVGFAGAAALASTLYHVPPVHRFLSPLFNDTFPLWKVPSDEDRKVAVQRARKWMPHPIVYALMVGLNAIGLVLWAVLFGDRLARAANMHTVEWRAVLLTGITALIWAGLLMRSLVRPPVVPPWSALVIYFVFFASAALAFLDILYVRYVYGTRPEWATPSEIVLEATTGAISLLLALVAGSLRFNSPMTLAMADGVGLDDQVTFWQWMTFSWMTPLIMKWSATPLNEEDLPQLSATLRTRELFDFFQTVRKSKLLFRILSANRFDVMMDGAFTLSSVIFNYLSPFLLKKILDGLTHPTSTSITQAYLFAFAALLTSILKAVSDMIHLWHSRRANVRIRSQLISAIYHKALLRKDTAGIVASKDKEETADKKDGKKADPKAKSDKKDKKADEKSETADTGKVVNLMSTDANMVAGVFAMAYYLYSTPIEITVASIFLYQLLGWSAFAGIGVLLIATPINSYLSKKAMRIQKDLLKARDKRMTVMNELIGGISFIKFFAWTEKWKGRAQDARNNELSQMIRSIINNMFFQLTWMLVPIFVTLSAFFCYIYFAKKDLTISVAFTALTLFNMLRTPLNAVPMFIVWFLQAGVSVKRTQDFFEEGEVPDWVSSLKRHDDGPSKKPKIGFNNATFKWNAGGKDEAETKNGTAAPSATEVTGADAGSPQDDESIESVVFELSDITIDFPIGKLSVVSGPTGAGKTAILIGLLGEMDLIEGESFLPKHPSQIDPTTGLRNSCAYAAQTPWLQQQSIKENILFGEPLDEERYQNVVDACALRTDFDILEDGDQTEIGAKGVSLSGGQKARVALARAVYSYTQHVLLDDPLAAVDSHTAKHLVDNCFNGPLLKGRTIILVSHHLDLLLPTADYIVRILDGRVDCQGTPKELQDSGELDGVVAIEDATAATKEPVTPDEPEEEEEKLLAKQDAKKDGPARKLVKDEERAVGSVKLGTYLLYFRAATWTTWMLFFAVLMVSQAFGLLDRLWLKWWGEHYESKLYSIFTFSVPQSYSHAMEVYRDAAHHVLHTASPRVNQTDSPLFTVQAIPPFNLPSADDHPGYYLGGYAIIMVGSALLMVVTNGIGAWGSYRAAKSLHDRLLDSVVHGTIRFFNTTPVGRIINRFSKDVETIDMRLNSSSRTVITFTASLVFTIGMIAYIIPQFLIPAAFISALYYYYTVLYLRTGRSLRRLEATTRSPIFSGFAELLDGIISVRAFSAERRMFSKLCEQVDLSNSAFYYYWMTNRWLLLRFDCLGAAAVFITTLLSLTGAVGVGYAAVAITSAQSFVMACYWLSRFWGEMEMDFNSVERVEEYLRIPSEPASVIDGSRPPSGWPSYDRPDTFISAQDLEIKYAPELPTVFKGSFDIKAGEKIGLIGRTGSGKSTIAMMMLRFTDPASGKLLIDGVDITTIGVDDLRSKITYIPQDAVLFSGTMRDNLDPFHEHTDSELLEALQRVKLITGQTPAGSRMGSTRNLTALAEIDAPSHNRLTQLIEEERAAGGGGRSGSSSGRASGTQTPTSRVHITLNTDVSAGGANFSQGQRQLVAMARALLRRSNLIIMDEATASVDFATDEALQNAIRTEFKDSTLITIAHRLSSVIDYDRLLVLRDGSVAEFDTPMNLLRRDDSIFKSMAQNSGKYKDLYAAAERKEKGDKGKAVDNDAEDNDSSSPADADVTADA